VLLPEDLVAMTRRRLVLVVDSDCAAAFERVHAGHLAYAPLLLLSPTRQPPSVPPAAQVGKLFTLFLSAPVHGAALACRAALEVAALRRLQVAVDAAVRGLDELLPATEDGPWVMALQDPFLRRLVLRFALCRALLAQVRAERSWQRGGVAE